MVQKVNIAAIQMAVSEDRQANVRKAAEQVRAAAASGAQLILLPELFESVYFPQTEREEYFSWAQELDSRHSFLGHFCELAKQLKVVLPLSVFEKSGHSYYNSLAMIDATGDILGIYRKAHIPDGPCYEEKFYFSPGNTEPMAFETAVGNIGCGICWDQWFPEVARCLALQGAEILLYPTAIGSEPKEANGLDTRAMWRRAMVGHAVSNGVHVVAANRVGTEGGMTFYGHTFVCDPTGEIVDCQDTQEERVILAEVELEHWRLHRAGMGFFRDRRPELYGSLLQRESHPFSAMGKQQH